MACKVFFKFLVASNKDRLAWKGTWNQIIYIAAKTCYNQIAIKYKNSSKFSID